MADDKLDKGFQDVTLDKGFEEIPHEQEEYKDEMSDSDKLMLLYPGAWPYLAAKKLGQHIYNAPAEQLKGEAKAAGLGATQGATFGTSDEIAAYALSKKNGTKYEDELKKIRDIYKQSEQHYPKMTMAGDIAGGLATTPLMPEFAMAPVTKGLGALIKPTSSLGKLTLGGAKAVEAGAEMGALGAAGKTEAPMMNVDQSGPLINPEFTSDVEQGAKSGSELAGGIYGLAKTAQAVPKVVKGIGNLLSKSKDIGDISEIAQREFNGDQVLGETSKLYKELRDFAKEDMTPALSKKLKEIGDNYDTILKNAKNKGTTIDVSDLKKIVTDADELLKPGSGISDEVRQQIGELRRFVNEEVLGRVPTDVPAQMIRPKSQEIVGSEYVPSGEEKAQQKLKEKFAQQELTTEETQPLEYDPNKVEQVTTSAGPQGLSTIGPNSNKMGQVIKDTPAYTKLDVNELPEVSVPEIKSGASDVGNPLLTPEKASRTEKTLGEMSGNMEGEARVLAAKGGRSVDQQIMQSMPEYAQNEKAWADMKTGFNQMGIDISKHMTEQQKNDAVNSLMGRFIRESGDNLSALEAKAKTDDFFKYMDKVDPKISAELKPVYEDKLRKVQLAHGAEWEGMKSSDLLKSLVGGASIGVKNVVGYSARGLRNALNMTPESWRNIASTIASKGTKQAIQLSRVLTNMAEKDAQGRNALMFSLMQDPTNRKMIKELAPELGAGFEEQK